MNMKQKFVAVAVVQAVAAMGLAANAFAQTTTTEPQKVERVEVTGSSIKRVDAEGALPVQVLRREDIDKSGARNAAELIQNLPIFQGYTNAGDSVGGGGGGFSGASLRNQGETRTLVLLNGKRIAPSGSQALTGAQAAVNLNNLPISAIERVEILSDGASALYGSDAIGGVVNFITRRDVSFVELQVGFASPDKNKGNELSYSATAGTGAKGPNGWNLMAVASVNDRKPLASIDREFAKTGLFRFREGGKEYEFQLGSPRGIPANVEVGGVLITPTYYPSRQCPPQHFFFDTACYFDFTSQLEIYPEQKTENAILSFTKNFGAHTLTAEYMYSKNSTISRLAPPPGNVPIAADSPYAQIVRDGAAAAGLPAPVFPVTAVYRVVDAGKRTTNDRSKLDHVSLELKGSLGTWDYATSYTRSKSTYDEVLLGGWVQLNPFLAALRSGKINPFIAPGTQTAEAQALLDKSIIRGKFDGGSTTVDFVEARVSRPLFAMSGGDASLAAGLNYLGEKFDKTPSLLAQGIGENNVPDTRLGDSSAIIPYSATRKSYGLFAEALIPFTKQFEVTPSVRYDDYSDFGSSTNYKLAARFQPSKQVLFRGSYGTGFKAPTVPQLNAAQQPFGVTGGTYSCATTPALATIAAALGASCPSGSVQFDQIAGGNKSLKPEESKQWTVGFRLEPNDRLSFGLDAWSVKIDNTIGQIGEDVVFRDPARYSQSFVGYVDPATGRTLLAYLAGNVNLGKSQTDGIDIDAQARTKFGFGQLTTQFTATYITKNKFEVVPGEGFLSDLNAYVNGGVTHKLKLRFANTLEHGAWAHTLALNYRDGYKDDPNSEVFDVAANEYVLLARKSKAYTTFDWQTRWSYRKSLTATLGVINLANQRPPLSITQNGGGQMVGYDARYGDSRGRTLYANLSYKFQ
jgi:iron complex outermembrane recepter protein